MARMSTATLAADRAVEMARAIVLDSAVGLVIVVSRLLFVCRYDTHVWQSMRACACVPLETLHGWNRIIAPIHVSEASHSRVHYAFI